MKKVKLDENKCIGCGYCFSVATANFECNDERRASLISDEVTDEAIEASESCPVSAISISSTCNCDEKCECGDECNCTDECECKKKED